MNAKTSNVRGQPNYKRRLQDYLESLLEADPTFEDHEKNSELHLAIIFGNTKKFEELLGPKGELSRQHQADFVKK